MNGRIWDFWAQHYDSLWVQRAVLEPSRREIIRNIDVRAGMTLLDAGCGTGQLYGDLKAHFGDEPFCYKGIDQSEQMVREALSKYPSADFAVVPAEQYESPHEEYDFIISANSFPYLPDKARTLLAFRNMLKPGGVLIIVQASMNNLYDAVVLSLVKLTTSKASYLSRKRMRELAAPIFQVQPELTRISPNLLVPSVYLFKWTRVEGADQ